MNTKNNQRYLHTHEKLQQTFIQLLSKKPLNTITVSEICTAAKVNRATFYIHFTDIYDLMEKIEAEMSEKLFSAYWDQHAASIGKGFEEVFSFVQKNAVFYGVYMDTMILPGFLRKMLPSKYSHKADAISGALGYTSPEEAEYHERFFIAGLTGIIRLWLQNGCRETPREMSEIISREYTARKKPASWN